MLKQRIEQDLKVALLEGDKHRATTLRSLKSAILYAEVAQGARQQGLDDEQVIAILSKEAKKRQESADVYSGAHEVERAKVELSEKAIIDSYLPRQLSDEDLQKLIDKFVTTIGPGANIGEIISKVREEARGAAEGARIARFVKERLGQQ